MADNLSWKSAFMDMVKSMPFQGACAYHKLYRTHNNKYWAVTAYYMGRVSTETTTDLDLYLACVSTGRTCYCKGPTKAIDCTIS